MDPRIERTRAAVLRAATDLLVEGGPSALTIDAVVARSGVAKSTVYRHWASRDELLVAVIKANAPRLPTPDPSSDVVGALRDVLRGAVAVLRDPEWARMLPALMMLRHHEADIQAIERQLEDDQIQAVGRWIERGIDEGLIAADTDIGDALGSLLGPVMFAHFTDLIPLEDAFADRIVDRFLAAYRPGALAEVENATATAHR